MSAAALLASGPGHSVVHPSQVGGQAHQAPLGRRARHDLRFHVHPDVLFPPDWEQRQFAALAGLEARDPRWGVVGAVGRRT
ncbi:MAG: hypothetical protein FJ296_01345, partial [Planctomycetes bacterium]|nr:hypothetical protein [Planctomycetota bacterium]